jgi:hypothetical protein
LGTYWGASYFCFVQAMKDAGIDSTCFAIDTWQGDPHSGYYPEDVYRVVSDIARDHYSTFAALIRCTFDEAVSKFDDNSVDLLHIDGFHTYEAVLHDYETWLPKLAEHGIILFHDIAVKWADFGVYKLWEDLKTRYPYIEFNHSYGLGVLFPKGCPASFRKYLSLKDMFQKIYGNSGV